MASTDDPLAEALRENQKLRQELKYFLYAVSHDLQEPLRSVIAYAQLLDRQDAVDPLAREYSAFVLSGAHRIRDILQQMLTWSRAGSSNRRSTISLNLPLQRAMVKLAPAISSSSASIVHADLPDALADEAEIAQVFESLLRNSLRFRSAATPEIIIEAEEGSDECTIIVRDNGSGVEPAFCEEVLLPFKRLHGKDVSGAGLGLAICDKIVRAHSGRLWVESDGLHGTTVRFTLPL